MDLSNNLVFINNKIEKMFIKLYRKLKLSQKDQYSKYLKRVDTIMCKFGHSIVFSTSVHVHIFMKVRKLQFLNYNGKTANLRSFVKVILKCPM